MVNVNELDRRQLKSLYTFVIYSKFISYSCPELEHVHTKFVYRSHMSIEFV